MVTVKNVSFGKSRDHEVPYSFCTPMLRLKFWHCHGVPGSANKDVDGVRGQRARQGDSAHCDIKM
jgi:hypothetical protein